MRSEIITEKIKSSYIRKHPLFANMPAEEIHEIASSAQLVHLRKKVPYTLNDRLPPKIYFLVVGAARIERASVTGTGFIKDILIDGGVFGDLSLNGAEANGSITALTQNTYFFYFTSTVFRKLMLKYQELLPNYAEIIGNKQYQLEERHYIWLNTDAKCRLLHFLRDWSRVSGIKAETKLVLENPFSLHDIADYIGVSRQFMHVLLKTLKEEGLVRYSRKKIELSYALFGVNQEVPKKAG